VKSCDCTRRIIAASRTESQAYYSVQRRARLPSAPPAAHRCEDELSRQRVLRLDHRCHSSGSSQARCRQLDVTGALHPIRDTTHQPRLQASRALSSNCTPGGAPVQTVRCLAGPTAPRPSPRGSATRLAAHRTAFASITFSLSDTDPAKGGQMLRHLLALHADPNDRWRNGRSTRRSTGQSQGRRSRPIPGGGTRSPTAGESRSAWTLDESAFECLGTLRLGAVLERFFARHSPSTRWRRDRLQSARAGRSNNGQYGRPRRTASEALQRLRQEPIG